MSQTTYSTRGKHIIVDAYGIKPYLLNSVSYLKQLGRFALAIGGCNLVSIVEKKFEPFGVTVLFLLEESHLAFHSFLRDMDDKDSLLCIDLYTCGNADTDAAINYILEQLQPDPNRTYRQTIIRGIE